MKTLQEIGIKDIPQAASYERNLEKYGFRDDTCICCGRPTSSKLFIQTVDGPDMIKANVTEEDLEALDLYPQGMFPIGSVCAKKVGKKYLIKG